MLFECSAISLFGPLGGWAVVTSLFMGGLFGGLTHCAFMCAPFVVMLQQKTVGRLASVLLIPYHFGRMTTYVALGVLANLFLSLAFPVSPLRYLVAAAFLGLAGLVFLVQSLPFLACYLPFLARLHLPVPLAPVQKVVSSFLEKGKAVHLYIVGVILGFIPCGLVMGALLAVAMLDGPLSAGLGMAAFCAGTVPALLGVALGGKAVSAILSPDRMALFSRTVMALSGLMLIAIAAGILALHP